MFLSFSIHSRSCKAMDAYRASVSSWMRRPNNPCSLFLVHPHRVDRIPGLASGRRIELRRNSTDSINWASNGPLKTGEKEDKLQPGRARADALFRDNSDKSILPSSLSGSPRSSIFCRPTPPTGSPSYNRGLGSVEAQSWAPAQLGGALMLHHCELPLAQMITGRLVDEIRVEPCFAPRLPVCVCKPGTLILPGALLPVQ